MTKQMQELLAKRDAILNEMDNLEAGTEEFSNKLTEANNVINAIEQQKQAEELKKSVDKETAVVPVENKLDGFKAIADVLRGRVTNESKQLIQGGDNHENYLIPEDVQVAINEYKKEWKSAKMLCNVEQSDVVTGKRNFDVAPTDGLVVFADGDTLDDQVAPSFVQKTYTITYKGAFIPVSNLLQGNEKAGLMAYLAGWFVKRAIIKENSDIFAAAKANYASGTPKQLADWKALKSSINKDLDPAYLQMPDFRIVTNQSGFDVLDSALDDNGRPVLQPDPTNPTRRLFMGYPVEVFSDAQLPNRSTYAPIIYGATKEALWYIENPSYQFASDEGKGLGFTKNQTILRVLEGYTVMGTGAPSYIYGELPLA